jgi:chemotaxis protein methyltransferase CheR
MDGKMEHQDLVDEINSIYGLNIDRQLRPTQSEKLALFKKKNVSLTTYNQKKIINFSKSAFDQIVEIFLVKNTSFFRDKAQFFLMEQVVLPNLIDQLSSNTKLDIRIWSTGCSTGEEPYSILLTLLNYFKEKYWFIDCGVLATDVSSESLKVLERGEYSISGVLPENIEIIKEYCDINDDLKFEFPLKLRSEITARNFNLNSEVFPFKKKFHIIFCRNVLIHFNQISRENCVKKIINAIEPNGYLFLGDAETININKYQIKAIGRGIYQKTVPEGV